MAAGNWNFTIEQGATFTRTILVEDEGTPRDLTGYTARLHIRRRTSLSDTILELTTPASGLSIPTPANGEIVMTISDETTAVLDFDGAVYDLELEDSGGDVERLLQGTVALSLEVTR